jgi:DnaJ-class molecular chaperone
MNDIGRDQAHRMLDYLRDGGDPCTDCDGKGFYTAWPHTTCPTCKGAGHV